MVPPHRSPAKPQSKPCSAQVLGTHPSAGPPSDGAPDEDEVADVLAMDVLATDVTDVLVTDVLVTDVLATDEAGADVDAPPCPLRAPPDPFDEPLASITFPPQAPARPVASTRTSAVAVRKLRTREA
jgi:hypothetical protein